MNSICSLCEHSRNVSSEELREKGFIGCTQLLDSPFAECIPFEINCHKMFTGWVDLKTRPGHKLSGVRTNGMLITSFTTECEKFIKIKK